VRDDRHARRRRAAPDRRRRPVDGFRTRDRERFARLVADALAELPDSFHEHLAGALVLVDDVPTVDADDTDAAFTTFEPGREAPRTRRGRTSGTPVPARLKTYRRPIEARATSKADLADLVRELVVLEVADHLGLDEDDLDELGWL
jgi:predicted Zn-dependent protease with MMP-like domain